MQKTRKIRLQSQSLTVSGNRNRNARFSYNFEISAENPVIYGGNDLKDLIFNYSSRIKMSRNFYDRRNFCQKNFGNRRGINEGL